jgi:hypothetical protein
VTCPRQCAPVLLIYMCEWQQLDNVVIAHRH